VIDGYAVVDDSTRPDTGTALIRFCSYLTIWSNVLVAWSPLSLALGKDRDTTWWRALRLDAMVICFGGGVVHFFLLRPHLSHLYGWSIVADRFLHLVVPILAAIGWLVFGPRGRATRRDVGPFLVVPVLWLVYTLFRGPLGRLVPVPVHRRRPARLPDRAGHLRRDLGADGGTGGGRRQPRPEAGSPARSLRSARISSIRTTTEIWPSSSNRCARAPATFAANQTPCA
jgi:hypothetical protein